MAIQTCPTDILAAPPDWIWHLLVNPKELAGWSGTKLIAAPDHALTAGDQVLLAPLPGFRVTIDVRGVEPFRTVALDVQLPFGVVNQEVIQLSAVDGGRARVTFN